MAPDGLQGSFDLIKLAGEALALGAILIKMGRMAGTFEEVSKNQTKEISEMKEEMSQLNDIVTKVAVQKAGMDNLQAQITTLTKWYDELRHGEGYISRRE